MNNTKLTTALVDAAELEGIAAHAVDQIGAAVEQLDWLHSSLHVVLEHLQDDPAARHHAKLLALLIYNADDWHSQLDGARARLVGRLAALGGGQ